MERTGQSRISLKATSESSSRVSRVSNTLSIRKNKRFEEQMKRRTTSSSSSTPEQDEISRLPEMTEAVLNGKRKEAYDALVFFRQLSACDQNPYLEQISQCNIIPRVVTFLKYNSHPNLQVEALWLLTNMASGSTKYVKMIVDLNVVPELIRLLDSPSDDVISQAVWCLSNIIGEGPDYRKICIKASVFSGLSKIITSTKNLKCLQISMWCMRNFFAPPLPNPEYVLRIIPIVAKLMLCKDTEILRDTLNIVSHISSAKDKDTFITICASAIPKHLECVCFFIAEGEFTDNYIISYVVKTIGNIACGDDAQTDRVITPKILSALRKILLECPSHIKCDTAFALSNMVSGTTSQIYTVLGTDILKIILEQLSSVEFNLKREFMWVLVNITRFSSKHQLRRIISDHKILIKSICDFLTINDQDLLPAVLHAISCILQLGQDYVDTPAGFSINPYRIEIEKVGGLDKLEDLQRNENDKIYELALEIVTTYFDAAPIIDAICELQPQIAEGGQSFLFTGI